MASGHAGSAALATDRIRRSVTIRLDPTAAYRRLFAGGRPAEIQTALIRSVIRCVRRVTGPRRQQPQPLHEVIKGACLPWIRRRYEPFDRWADRCARRRHGAPPIAPDLYLRRGQGYRPNASTACPPGHFGSPAPGCRRIAWHRTSGSLDPYSWCQRPRGLLLRRAGPGVVGILRRDRRAPDAGAPIRSGDPRPNHPLRTVVDRQANTTPQALERKAIRCPRYVPSWPWLPLAR